MKPIVLKRVFMAAFTLCIAPAFTGCMGNRVPDEMAVIDGPPLAIPPDFELRPPVDAKAYKRQQAVQKDNKAKAFLLGEDSPQEPPSQNSWFLEKTGKQADPNIREKLEDEYDAGQVEDKKTLMQKWFGGEEDSR